MRQLRPDFCRLEDLEAIRCMRRGGWAVHQVQFIQRAPELIMDAVLSKLQLRDEVWSERPTLVDEHLLVEVLDAHAVLVQRPVETGFEAGRPIFTFILLFGVPQDF